MSFERNKFTLEKRILASPRTNYVQETKKRKTLKRKRHKDELFEISVLPVRTLVNTWSLVRYKEQFRLQIKIHLYDCRVQSRS